MANTYKSWQTLWLKLLLFVLFGYAFLGRTFAYCFFGEAVLLVGLVIFLLRPRFTLILSNRFLFLWGIFACLGLIRTIPFLSIYKFNAIRDAVVWGYGLFALLIVAFVNRSSQVSMALNTYRKFVRWFLPIIPFFLALAQFGHGIPHLPWASDITVLALKAPDTGVHIGAAGLFLLMFPADRAGHLKPDFHIDRIVCLIGWSLCATEIVVLSRGGFVAMMIAICGVCLLKPRTVGWRVGALGIGVIVFGLLVLEFNVISTNVRGRSLNADTVTRNIDSITGNGSGAGGQEENKTWRLVWWRRIVNYTIFGPYFWTGKGFGVNLATSDGPPGIPPAEARLRSPHNGHLTVLARMGVPGLCLWITLNLFFAASMFRAFRIAERAGSKFWSNVNLWILAYWLSLVINMSFDVYLEGPQGGIWYWSIMGFGAACLRIQAFEARQARLRARFAESMELELPVATV